MKRIFSIITLIFTLSVLASAQTTAFNFQGRLNDGTSPANGKYDLQFRLYDAPTGDNLIGTAISKLNTMLVNGVFSTQLDFGANAFDGSDRFIEIRLRVAGTENGYVILGPRQQILSVPYTVRSSRATLADNATLAVNSTNAQTANNSLNLGGTPAANYLKYNNNQDVEIGGTPTFPNLAPPRLYVVSRVPSILPAIATEGGVAVNGNLGVSGDSSVGGKLAVTGNLSQPLTANGLPKATVRLDRSGNITACYSAVTGASTGNCGFAVSHPNLGEYNINFGFDVSNRVVNLTTEYDGGFTIPFIYSRNNTQIQIVVDYTNSGDETNAPVNIVVY